VVVVHAALRQVRQCVLEAAEVARGEQVQRAAVRAVRPQPAPERGRTRALLGVAEEIEQDRQLRPVLELPAEQLERARVERPDQLLVGEPEERL
jgi:DNA-binding transcriptional regulator/RsmH inhibitor MraZ